MDIKEAQAAVEAILCASGDPVGVERLCIALDMDRPTVEAICQQMMDKYSYERSGLRLLRMDTAYQLCTAPDYVIKARRVQDAGRPPRISDSAMEVMAIIAYFQPVTKTYIDSVRGVDSAYHVRMLQDRDLIEECGRLNAPGRPILYRTTKVFLREFNLRSLNELGDLPEAPDAGAEEGEQITIRSIKARIEELEAQEARKAGTQAGEEAEHETPRENLKGRKGQGTGQAAGTASQAAPAPEPAELQQGGNVDAQPNGDESDETE